MTKMFPVYHQDGKNPRPAPTHGKLFNQFSNRLKTGENMKRV